MPVLIEPGATIGVLGGGQLGAMFAQAARRLGYQVAVWDPDSDAPAFRSADVAVNAPFEDSASLEKFSGSVSAATYEWENIPASVAAALEQRMPLRPSGRILSLLQDRLDQKIFLTKHGFPVAPFRPVLIASDVLTAVEQIGLPCVCKTTRTGYDGKGQWRLTSKDEAAALQEEFQRTNRPGTRWIVEGLVAFEKELSVVVARAENGERRIYPPVENIHEHGILRLTREPANVDFRTVEHAMALASSVTEALKDIGVFCVEMFFMSDGTLLVNEVAPRPHNSGHYTLEACSVSQFEQQVRALCGLPLGEIHTLCSAAMVNLIGDDIRKVTAKPGLLELLRTPGARLHVYGKRVVRPRRKMGHVTFISEKADEAWTAALALRRLLGDSA
jgi:5-(carboxyamino)imidazole ribonucleotide synthase